MGDSGGGWRGGVVVTGGRDLAVGRDKEGVPATEWHPLLGDPTATHERIRS